MGDLTGKVYFFSSQYPLVVCSSLAMVEALWTFPCMYKGKCSEYVQGLCSLSKVVIVGSPPGCVISLALNSWLGFKHQQNTITERTLSYAHWERCWLSAWYLFYTLIVPWWPLIGTIAGNDYWLVCSFWKIEWLLWVQWGLVLREGAFRLVQAQGPLGSVLKVHGYPQPSGFALCLWDGFKSNTNSLLYFGNFLENQDQELKKGFSGLVLGFC